MSEFLDGDVELSVVVPVYKEEGNIPEFLSRIVPILDSCVASYEIIFSVDPSPDGTERVISDAAAHDPRVRAIVFSRRFGQPTATLAGLDVARGDAVVVIDVDLQDPPELIGEMVSLWRDGHQVVYAQRRSRKGETLIKRIVANVGYRVIDRFGEVSIPRNTGDFRLLDRIVVNHLKEFPETHGFLRGLVALVGFDQVAIEFDRPERFAGKGNYNRFFGSLRIGFNGLVGFSSALLNLSTVFGLAAAMVAILVAIAYGIAKIIGARFPIGNTTIVVIVLSLGGLQLMCLGIAGQYIGRIYDEVKRRPRYIVARTIGAGRART